MPFLRYANARVVHTRLNDGGWDRVRVASGQVRSDRDLVDQASKILQADFSPTRYLLTHATIVASVDTEKVPGVKVGSATVDGKKVIRKTAEFRIKPECDIYINNNLDSWSRKVLAKSYKTFVGGHSFLEHVQVEALSKGRILDAVLRDVGDSTYVDILVANDRKHTQLISDIESGRISTLSMGCSIDGSTCTFCGHWAADETEMCEHVRFQKGNSFFDDRGARHRIAELCGDDSLDPTGGVQFIEASWVEVPAFKGAVARNVITLDSDKAKTASLIQDVFASDGPGMDLSSLVKTANLKEGAEDFDFGGGGGEEPAPEEVKPTEPPKGPFEEVEKELTENLIDKVKGKVKEELDKDKGMEALNPTESSAAPNDTVVKQAEVVSVVSTVETPQEIPVVASDPIPAVPAAAVPHEAGIKKEVGRVYTAALRTIVATSTQEVDLLEKIATLNQELGVFVPQSLYRVGLKVGSTRKYPSLVEFVGACTIALGRAPTASETRTLIRLGTLLTAFGNRQPSHRTLKE